MQKFSRVFAFCFFLMSFIYAPGQARLSADSKAIPLVIGETFTINSKALGETRRINVYLPPGYRESPNMRVPVLYMPDGGIAEDFLHVAGLVQVSAGNGTMRPFLLVGIENTERRRDMTGPTEKEEDKKIAPRVGGSAAFRKFIRDELMAQVKEESLLVLHLSLSHHSRLYVFIHIFCLRYNNSKYVHFHDRLIP